MAADTAPAAVPDPRDRPQPASAQPGLIASMLAAVEPARTVAHSLDPAAAEPGDLAAVSSAAFHDDDTTTENPKATGNSTAGRQKDSVVRAWLLAGAERWKKGAGSGIKRLEVEKARAMAQQVKETRTVTVNRTPPAPAKGTSSGSSSGGGSASRGAKGPAKSSSSTGPTPKNTTSGAGGGAGRTNAPAPASGTTIPKQTSPKPPKPVAAPAAGKSSGTSGGTSSARAGKTPGASSARDTSAPAGKTGSTKPTPDTAAKTAPTGKTTTATKPEALKGKQGDRGPAGTAAKPDASKGERKTGATTKPDTAGKPDDDTKRPAEPAAKTTDTTKPETKKEEKAADPKAATSKPTTVAKPDAEKKPTTAPAPTGPLHTREARETGYRDGARAGRTAAQVRAYRDGVKDGWADTTEAAAAEKTALDQAHAARKQDRDKEPAMPAAAPPRPTRAPAVPIPVTDIDAASVHLGPGANRTALARSEVRTLKQFERRLAGKQSALQAVAESTKGLKDHAEQQADYATRLYEAAKTVEGGAQLLADLARLQETAQAQAATAEEVHTRAVRAADSCGAVLTNVTTRYGGIYKAVVDSPLTTPADFNFYKEQ
ncbi:hypothetical protein [Streptomyces sp. NPDC058745]|uniref:hypothetical protein n=1 Tax=Streptomyces sp. NPDC058745 TaxID=3346621 RepID=UPI0036B7FC40